MYLPTRVLDVMRCVTQWEYFGANFEFCEGKNLLNFCRLKNDIFSSATNVEKKNK